MPSILIMENSTFCFCEETPQKKRQEQTGTGFCRCMRCCPERKRRAARGDDGGAGGADRTGQEGLETLHCGWRGQAWLDIALAEGKQKRMGHALACLAGEHACHCVFPSACVAGMASPVIFTSSSAFPVSTHLPHFLYVLSNTSSL